MLLLMEKEEESQDKPFAMWTNYRTLLQSYGMLFDLMWREPSQKPK
jgi:hypothetical protein